MTNFLNYSSFRIPRKEIETRLALKDSMSSVTLDLVKDTSEIKVRRNSDSSGDARTVRFSLQDTGIFKQIKPKSKLNPEYLRFLSARNQK